MAYTFNPSARESYSLSPSTGGDLKWEEREA